MDQEHGDTRMAEMERNPPPYCAAINQIQDNEPCFYLEAPEGPDDDAYVSVVMEADCARMTACIPANIIKEMAAWILTHKFPTPNKPEETNEQA